MCICNWNLHIILWYLSIHNHCQKYSNNKTSLHVFFWQLSKLTAVGKLCFVLSTKAFVFQWLFRHLKFLHNCVVKTIPFAFVWVGHVAAPGQHTATAILTGSMVTLKRTTKYTFQAALNRCGLLLHMLHAVWSTCLSVCVGHMNVPLGWLTLVSPKNRVKIPHGNGQFLGLSGQWEALGVSAAVYAAKGIIHSSITKWEPTAMLPTGGCYIILSIHHNMAFRQNSLTTWFINKVMNEINNDTTILGSLHLHITPSHTRQHSTKRIPSTNHTHYVHTLLYVFLVFSTSLSLFT